MKVFSDFLRLCIRIGNKGGIGEESAGFQNPVKLHLMN